jgi:hypothetical protein
MTTLTSRLYKDENDFQQMQDLLMEARLLTNDWHYAHVGELIFNYFMVACHLDPHEHIRLWYENKRLAGYAVLGKIHLLIGKYCRIMNGPASRSRRSGGQKSELVNCKGKMKNNGVAVSFPVPGRMTLKGYCFSSSMVFNFVVILQK